MKNIRTLTYQTGKSHLNYPELRLGGKFLKDKYYWQVGGEVRIEYLKDKIVIRNGALI